MNACNVFTLPSRSEKVDQFGQATSVSSLLAMVGSSMAAIHAGSLLFDSERIPTEEYVARTFDADVLQYFRDAIPVRTAMRGEGPVVRESFAGIDQACEESHTIILAGILMAAKKDGDSMIPNSRARYFNLSRLLQVITKGDCDLYSACCKVIGSGLR